MAEAKHVKRKVKKKISVFRIILLIVFMAITISIGAIGGKVLAIVNSTPKLTPDALTAQSLSTSLYAKDNSGKWVRIALFHGNDNRLWVSIKKIPKNLQNAIIAIEDQRFREHHGIDFKRIMGALIADIKTRSFSEGGSTITQQLVKNTILTDQKTITRKIQEAVLAWQVENMYSKDQILEAYLNTIFLGSAKINAYGVEAASLAYFGKDVSQLDLAESAMIAGITNNPSMYSPDSNKIEAKKRQELVLSMMLENHFITKEQYEQAKAEKLVYKSASGFTDTNYKHQYFVEQVVKDVASEIAKRENLSENEALKKIYTGGFKIYTTLDFKIQNAIEKNFENNDLFPNNKIIKNKDGEKEYLAQGAMVVMDPRTGEIKGMIGGRGKQSGRFILNRAEIPRQPGSSIKPITVYTPAIDNGYTAASVIDDAPVTFNIPGSGPWKPENFEGTYSGLVNIRTAIQHSINVVAAKLVMEMGVQTSYNYAKKFGLSTLTETDKLSPAGLSLGGLTRGVTPIEMAAAYAALDNNGIYTKPITYTKVLDANNNVVIDNTPVRRAVVSPQVAYIMKSLMQTVVNYGTGTKARLPGMAVAGKTGTTDDYKNAWFDGFTPYYVGVVWMGYDVPNTIIDRYGSKVVGGSYPAMMWKAVMQDIHQGLEPRQFQMPDGIVSANVCKDSGDLPTNLCASDPRGNRIYNEIFIQGTQPTTYCKVHVAASIDTSTGKLATSNCPPQFVKTMVFIQPPGRPPELNRYTDDGRYVVPTQVCDVHKSKPVKLQPTNPTPNSQNPNQTPEPKPNTTPEPKPNPTPGAQTQPNPTPGAQTQPNPTPGAQTQPNPTPGAQTQPNPTPEPKPNQPQNAIQ